MQSIPADAVASGPAAVAAHKACPSRKVEDLIRQAYSVEQSIVGQISNQGGSRFQSGQEGVFVAAKGEGCLVHLNGVEDV